MALSATSAWIPSTVTTEVTVLTHVAAAGTFLRGWSCIGDGGAHVLVKIDGNIQDMGALEDPTGNGYSKDGSIIAPVALVASQTVTVSVLRRTLTVAVTRNYQAVLY